MSVTRYFSYVVGNNCSLHQETNTFTDFTFTNPSHDFISIASDFSIDTVEIFNLIGNKVITQSENTNQIDVSNLSKGIYLMVVYSEHKKGIRKIIIN
ncbi:T9SS type A sorting domain-containing protein [Flavobacterium cyclinae]|nr:T9SS type A sorting domain-containing protein [Flavobacterium cyclinae]